jgi:hypothetical protein
MDTTAIAATNGNGAQLARLYEMDTAAIVDRKRKLVEVMTAVMREGEHYGRIPGCGDKPTLYKAGAEVLATVFGLAPRFEIAEVNLPGGHREYRITCQLHHISNGTFLGSGVGACSTMESKYRWRRAERKCPTCGKAGTIIKGKAEYGGGWLCYGKKGGCGGKWPDGDKSIESQPTDRVENPDVADVYNTVLKMAKKRAQVDATLTVVGASDILTQDLEDLPAGSARDDFGPRDAVDAEWSDAPSTARSRSADDDLLDAVDTAEDQAQLDALIPALAKLKGAAKTEGRKRYAARKSWLVGSHDYGAHREAAS